MGISAPLIAVVLEGFTPYRIRRSHVPGHSFGVRCDRSWVVQLDHELGGADSTGTAAVVDRPLESPLKR